MTEGVSLALADASTAADKPRKGEEGTNSRKKKEKNKNEREKKGLTKSDEACQGGSESPKHHSPSLSPSPVPASLISPGADALISRKDIPVSCLVKYLESPSLSAVVSSSGCSVLPGC